MPQYIPIPTFNSPNWVAEVNIKKFSKNFLSILNYFWKVYQWFLDSETCLKVCLDAKEDQTNLEMPHELQILSSVIHCWPYVWEICWVLLLIMRLRNMFFLTFISLQKTKWWVEHRKLQKWIKGKTFIPSFNNKTNLAPARGQI